MNAPDLTSGTPYPSHRISGGPVLPPIGFGTWKMSGAEVERAVRSALAAGYRLIDTAALYRNEAEVGRAIMNDPEVPREDIILTTKIWNDRQGYEESRRAFDEAEKRLAAGMVDLLLIHWPVPGQDKYVDTWRTFIELQGEGRVRSIGVSNFGTGELTRLIDETGVTPSVNQIEMHPFLSQEEVRAFDDEHGILTEAWSPLHQGTRVLMDPRIRQIAENRGISPAQVTLAWHLSKGVVPLPKTVSEERARENLAALEVVLSDEEVATIDAMNEDRPRSSDR